MPEFSRLDDISTVISILPFGISERKPGLIPGEYSIPGVKDPTKEVHTLRVGRARFPVYVDEHRPAIIVPEPSDRVCAAIVRDFVTGIAGHDPGKAEPGLAWMRGAFTPEETEKKFPAEMTQLREFQNNWFVNLVAIADDDWSKLHMRRSVSSLQKVACRLLGLEREWSIESELDNKVSIDQAQCKFCRGAIHFDAIVCMHCQGILDMNRYRTEFMSPKILEAASKLQEKVDKAASME